MIRRFTTLWLLTVALLGNLLSPALAQSCVAPETSSHVCPMSGKPMKTCCCCPTGNAHTPTNYAPQLSAVSNPCACQITPAQAHATSDNLVPLTPEVTAFAALGSILYTTPPVATFSTSPLAQQTQTLQTLPRAPDSGRAPPVS
ncbi:hypothetical protein [Armatimonas sp.]|uniref:hypothetical protein n=1 Tax=Armatimonas sp. TaxID=1872638 RepID=UPI003751FB3B